jgi:uncharacterized protein YdaU (DUF1376 family)
MSNKDPAVLWYTGDFLIGTSFMTNEQVGMYARLLAHQHQNGHLSEEQMMQICKTYVKEVFLKFVQDDNGLYYNERMDKEVNKRRNYSESRSKNRLSKKDEKDMSNICESHEEHMENGNENINKDISIKVSKKDIDIFFESIWRLYPKKEGKGQISDAQKKKLYSIGIEEMTRAINRYIEAKKGTERQYLKQGSTFFNSGYVDYMDSNYELDKPKSQYQDVPDLPEGWK